jgi:hypothetical protein
VCPPSISSGVIPRRSSATRRRNDGGNSRSPRSRHPRTRSGQPSRPRTEGSAPRRRDLVPAGRAPPGASTNRRRRRRGSRQTYVAIVIPSLMDSVHAFVRNCRTAAGTVTARGSLLLSIEFPEPPGILGRFMPEICQELSYTQPHAAPQPTLDGGRLLLAVLLAGAPSVAGGRRSVTRCRGPRSMPAVGQPA